MDELETYRAHIERHQEGGRRKYDPAVKPRGYFASGTYKVDAAILGLLGLAMYAMTHI